MTYCVAIEVNDGLVFAADTRTSGSFDDVRVYRKLHVYEWPGDRVFVILSAGNLATTQLMNWRLKRDAEDPNAARSLRTYEHLYDVAEYVGETLVGSQAKISEEEAKAVNVQATVILGGQIAGERPGLYLIYPLGNCIATSPETPYLQIGESKYGKPILDRIVSPGISLAQGAKCALISMDSTIRSNLSVGVPLDLLSIERDALKVQSHVNIDENHAYFRMIRTRWSESLRQAFQEIPDPEWMPRT